MKKRFYLYLLAVLSIFALVACSNQIQGGKAKGTEQPKELTALEVLTKANEAMKAAKGYKVEGKGTQMVEWTGQPKVEQELTIKCKANNNPAVTHTEMTLKMGGLSMKTEMYADKQNVYISDFMTGQWVKLPVGFASAKSSNDPMAELQKYKSLLEQLGTDKDKALQMKKENGQYVVTLDLAAVADKKEVKEMIGKIAQGMGASNPEYTNIVKELTSSLKIEKMKYVYYIDEKTFELKKQDSETRMQMGLDQKKAVIDQKMSFTIAKSDEAVTIPEEVKQKAKAQP